MSENYDTIVPYRQQLIGNLNSIDFFRKCTGFIIKIPDEPNNLNIFKSFWSCACEFLSDIALKFDKCIVCNNPEAIKQGLSIENLDKLEEYKKQGRFISDIWFIALDKEKGLMAVNYNKPFLSDYYKFTYPKDSIDYTKCIAFPFVINSYFLTFEKSETSTWCIVNNPGDVIYTPQEVPYEEDDLTFTQAVQFCIEDAKQTSAKEDFLTALNDYIIIADDIFPQYVNDKEILEVIKQRFPYPDIFFSFDLEGELCCYKMYLEDNMFNCVKLKFPTGFFSIYYDYMKWRVYNYTNVKNYWENK